MLEIEEAFQKTCALVLGERLPGKIDDYEKWLTVHVKGKVRKVKSAISSNSVYMPSVGFYERMMPNVVALEESLALGKKALSEADVGKLSLSNAKKLLSGIKATTPEIIYGTNVGSEECSCYGPTQFCYRSTFCWFSKFIGYSFWPRDSEHLFGCSNVAGFSSFSIRCYSSTKLTRCFEVNDSNNCSSSYFCHNCENVHDSMFCFNAKNLHYAIGNVEIGREAYLRLKKMLLERIHSDLSKKKLFAPDIYNIASK
jgi:hypothetical protein